MDKVHRHSQHTMVTDKYHVGSDVHTAVFWNYIFCDMTLYSVLKVNWIFGAAYCLHFLGRRTSQARKQSGAGSKQTNVRLIFYSHRELSHWKLISKSLKRKMYLSNGSPDLDFSMVSNGDEEVSRRITVILFFSSYVMKYDIAWN